MERYLARFLHSEDTPAIDGNHIKGIASRFGSVVETFMPTIILPRSFAKTTQDRKRAIKLKRDHKETIGVIPIAKEVRQGLEIDAEILPTTLGKDTVILCKGGESGIPALDELSIGFDEINGFRKSVRESLQILSRLNLDAEIAEFIRVQLEEYDPSEQIRFITEIRLWEVSIVDWGADPNTQITEVHRKIFDKYRRKDLPFISSAPAKEENAMKKKSANEKHAVLTVSDVMNQIRDLGSLLMEASTPADPNASDPYSDFDVWAASEQIRGLCSAILALVCMPWKLDPPPAVAEDYSDKIATNLITFHIKSLESFEGKVLSSKNKSLIKDALVALQNLLDAAEPPAKEEDSSAKGSDTHGAAPDAVTQDKEPTAGNALLQKTTDEFDQEIIDMEIAYLASLYPQNSVGVN